jgi:hypothetical protein
MWDGLDLACTDMDHMRSLSSKMVAEKSDHRSARSDRALSVMDTLQHTSTIQSIRMNQVHVGNTEQYHYPMITVHITLAQKHRHMVVA